MYLADGHLAARAGRGDTGCADDQRHAGGTFVELEFLPQPMVAKQLAVIGGIEDDGVALQVELAQSGEYLAQGVVELREIGVVEGDALLRLRGVAELRCGAVVADEVLHFFGRLREIDLSPGGRKLHVHGAEHGGEAARGMKGSCGLRQEQMAKKGWRLPWVFRKRMVSRATKLSK